MIECVQNGQGFSLACEYFLVDKHGQHQEKGEYIYIKDIQVAKGQSKKSTYLKLIKQLLRFDFLKYCYYRRGLHNTDYFYPRRKFEKLTRRMENVEQT